MKNLIKSCILLTTCFWVSGCAAGPYARQGATIGALVGTPVGAVIGSRNGESGAGALIGGTIGALTGSNIGSGIDAEHQALQQQAQLQRAFAPNGMAIHDVISMSQTGLSEDVIVTQIQNQGMNQRPSTNDLIALKQAGVSDRIVQAMQSSSVPSSMAPARIPPGQGAPVIVEEHYWGPGYDPYCDPPPRRFHRHHRPIRPSRRASFSYTHRF